MAETNTTLPVHTIVTAQQYVNILRGFVGVWMAVCLAGILSNVVNIKTFAAMGLHDSIAISFFALSWSDLFALLTYTVHDITILLRLLEQTKILRLTLDPFVVTVFCADIRDLFYLISTLITAKLAVVRCMSVAMPIRFRHVVTRSHTILLLAGIVLYACATEFPSLSALRIIPSLDPATNGTRLVISYAYWYYTATNFLEVANNITLTFATQAMLFVCVLVMAASLRSSSRFRKQNLAGRALDSRSTLASTAVFSGLSGRELQAVKQVALVSVVFLICNIPKITSGILRLSVPEYDKGERLQYLYFTGLCVKITFELANSAVNIFIYYKFSSKFQAKCPSFLRCTSLLHYGMSSES